MKKYTRPEIEITVFIASDIITASSPVNTGLTNKGAGGEPLVEDFNSIFESLL